MVERSQRALTLTELLFALVLLGILGSLALPGMAAWLDGNRERSVLHELSASIQLGRTHAVAYQRPVTLCPSTDGRHCGSDWERAGCLRKTVGNGFSWDARLQRRKAPLEPFEPPQVPPQRPAQHSQRAVSALRKAYRCLATDPQPAGPAPYRERQGEPGET